MNSSTSAHLVFVLSGFLIALRYYEGLRYDLHYLRQYVVKRVARIYPMYLLLTLETFLGRGFEGAPQDAA